MSRPWNPVLVLVLGLFAIGGWVVWVHDDDEKPNTPSVTPQVCIEALDLNAEVQEQMTAVVKVATAQIQGRITDGSGGDFVLEASRRIKAISGALAAAEAECRAGV